MTKTLIITSHIEALERVTLDIKGFDKVICADGGHITAKNLGITPDFLIGDYDSSSKPDRSDVILLPMEKDMTDSEAAIDFAVSEGFEHITLLGGLGGRFDHTMGNIGLLAKYCGKLKHLAICDGQNYVFMTSPGSVSIPQNEYKYLGIISYGGTSAGVTLKGVKYPLTDYTLTDATTLGVSNEITADTAEISFTSGKLLIILTKDIDG